MGDLGDDPEKATIFVMVGAVSKSSVSRWPVSDKRASIIGGSGYCSAGSTRIGTHSRGAHRDERGLYSVHLDDLPLRATTAGRRDRHRQRRGHGSADLIGRRP